MPNGGHPQARVQVSLAPKEMNPLPACPGRCSENGEGEAGVGCDITIVSQLPVSSHLRGREVGETLRLEAPPQPGDQGPHLLPGLPPFVLLPLFPSLFLLVTWSPSWEIMLEWPVLTSPFGPISNLLWV